MKAVKPSTLKTTELFCKFQKTYVKMYTLCLLWKTERYKVVDFSKIDL